MNRRIRIRKTTVCLFFLVAIGLVVGSFFVGKTFAKNELASSTTNIAEISNAAEKAGHSPRETYEAGWRACMRCWGIKSEEGLDYDNAKNTVFFEEERGFMQSKEVIVSEYYIVTDVTSARALFRVGFQHCMKYWSISYSYSNRSHDDDLTYAFNSWY